MHDLKGNKLSYCYNYLRLLLVLLVFIKYMTVMTRRSEKQLDLTEATKQDISYNNLDHFREGGGT